MESWFQIIFLDHDVDVDVRKENKRVFTKKIYKPLIVKQIHKI